MQRILLLISGFSDIETGATQIKGVGVYDSYIEEIKEKIIKIFICDFNDIFKSDSISYQLECIDISYIFEGDEIECIEIYGYSDGRTLALYSIPLNKIQYFNYYIHGGQ